MCLLEKEKSLKEHTNLQQCHESKSREIWSSKPWGKILTIPSISKSAESLEIPTAHRKGIRLYANHPISKFVSYNIISPPFHGFTSQLSSIEIPRNVQDALIVPEWRETILEEMKAPDKNKT